VAAQEGSTCAQAKDGVDGTYRRKASWTLQTVTLMGCPWTEFWCSLANPMLFGGTRWVRQGSSANTQSRRTLRS